LKRTGRSPHRARNEQEQPGRIDTTRSVCPKKSPKAERPKVKGIVDAILADHPDELKVTPGKIVYEIQPKIDWDKGEGVLYLLEGLDLDREDVVPIYLGDDITDEDAFEALGGRGIGIFVGRADDLEVAGRTTSADYALRSVEEVETFLDTLAR
jgi:trehalose 6-phosphate phosphatase